MAEGGFLVKFDGKEVVRCFAVAFDYVTDSNAGLEFFCFPFILFLIGKIGF